MSPSREERSRSESATRISRRRRDGSDLEIGRGCVSHFYFGSLLFFSSRAIPSRRLALPCPPPPFLLFLRGRPFGFPVRLFRSAPSVSWFTSRRPFPLFLVAARAVSVAWIRKRNNNRRKEKLVSILPGGSRWQPRLLSTLSTAEGEKGDGVNGRKKFLGHHNLIRAYDEILQGLPGPTMPPCTGVLEGGRAQARRQISLISSTLRA